MSKSQHSLRVSIARFAIVALAMLPTQVDAQDNVVSLSNMANNSSFEGVNGLPTDGWRSTGPVAEVLKRNWTANDNSPNESQLALGSQLIRLRGKGSWGQAINLFFEPQISNHILNAHAFKKAINGTGAGGSASIQVNYYDANWTYISNVTVPVGTRDASKNRGVGDGLNLITWGIKVPANAKRAYLFAYLDGNTELYLDGLSLNSFQNLSQNLILNAFASGKKIFLESNREFGQITNGAEFWKVNRDWSKPFAGTLGSATQVESMSQELITVDPLISGPNFPYPTAIYGFHGVGPKQTPASVGLDFWDANWNNIGKASFSVTNQSEFYRQIIIPPATKQISTWVWVDKLRAGDTPINFNTPGANLKPAVSFRYTGSLTPSEGSKSLGGYALRNGATITEAGVQVVYSDSDGIDLNSIAAQNVTFTKLVNPGRNGFLVDFNAVLVSKKLEDGGKLAVVRYALPAAELPNYASVVHITFRENQVKDSKGNFFEGSTDGIRDLAN